MDQDTKVTILMSLFIAAIIAANLLGNKITTFMGISFSVGIFAFPITFLITDIIAEVKGKEKAQHLVIGGMVSIAFVLLLALLSVALPAAERFPYNDAYTKIFGISTRILIASLVAFGFSQMHDIWSFEYWKKKTKGKFLWLRNNASTIVSQLIDTTVFMFIAFYHITPKFDVAFIISLILPYWGLKVIAAIADTPFVYWGVRWLKGK